MITICPACNSYWTVAEGAAAPKACPFCGAALASSEPEGEDQTMETCLAEIIGEFGTQCLLNRQKTIALISDTVPALKREMTLLERFYDVHGNEVYLAALGKPLSEQNTAFELIVKRLTMDQCLNESAARRICTNFWRAVGGSKTVGGSETISRSETVGTIRADHPREAARPEIRTKRTAHTAVPNPTADKAKELYEMGYRYEFGKTVAQNPKLAVQLYRKAADLGHSGAQRRLGWCYETGNGVLKMEGEAAKWYLSAAKQGDAAAQFLAARCYANGVGVRKDPGEALKWCRLSAEQGYAQAKTLLKKLMK